MPTPVKITGRISTITNSFVNGIVPCISPTEQEISEALQILGLDADDLHCAYCGDRATEWEHLRPLVTRKRPTGYISEIANLVPACSKCNQSKSGRNWREWITSGARLSPASRGITDLKERFHRLECFEAWRQPTIINFEEIVGSTLWEQHWQNLDRIVFLMRECEETARAMRDAIHARLSA
jgi:hypothetical protein